MNLESDYAEQFNDPEEYCPSERNEEYVPGHRYYEDSVEDFEWGDEDELPNDELVRAKWVIDGATTLAEAAEMAHAFGNELRALHDQGYVLRHKVVDDYGYYYLPENKNV